MVTYPSRFFTYLDKSSTLGYNLSRRCESVKISRWKNFMYVSKGVKPPESRYGTR